MQQQQAAPVSLNGVLEGGGAAGLRMTDNQNQVWHVVLQPGAVVQVKGTAKADFLTKGVCVEFQADLDAEGKAKEKLGQLSIASRGDDKQHMGVFSAESGTNTSKPLVKPTGPCRVVGAITSPNNDPMTVRAGRTTVWVELADDPTINIETSDLSLVSPGDKIAVTGNRMPPKNNNANTFQVRANSVTIELSQPLTSGKKKPAAKSNSKTTSRAKKDKEKDKDGDGKPD